MIKMETGKLITQIRAEKLEEKMMLLTACFKLNSVNAVCNCQCSKMLLAIKHSTRSLSRAKKISLDNFCEKFLSNSKPLIH